MANAFNVNNFRSKITRDVARPNLFSVNLTLPTFGDAQPAKDVEFKIKAAQLPGSTIGIAPLYYFGREIKLAGNRTFTDWTVQVINDESFDVRNTLEKWMNAINSHEGNYREKNFVTGGNQPQTNGGYTRDASVIQYGKDGQEIIKQYNFVGMFPVDIAPIDLDWGSNDTIEEFAVTFAYQYWTAATTDGNAIR
jgi:hypothetical protein